MKKILIMFVASLATISLCRATEVAQPTGETIETVTPITAEANKAVASKVDAEAGKVVAKRDLTRQEIRNMPILERPNRVGHFYGNTVRRRYNRTH